jgi:transcriptional regulator
MNDVTGKSGNESVGGPGGHAEYKLADLSLFERFSDQDALDLIAEYPLAWILPKAGGAGLPSLLPLVAQPDASGRLSTLVGHMSRRNPLVSAFTADCEALILFTGPSAYVSSSCVSDPRWAPTWNYAQLRIEGRLTLASGSADNALELLLRHMDRIERTGWRPRWEEARYRTMEKAVIAFEAQVTRLEGRFKLGQDESLKTLQEMLVRHPDPQMVAWMRRANRWRL